MFYNQSFGSTDLRRSPHTVVFTLIVCEMKDAPHLGDVKILFVCLGNICRSPTAEGVLRHLAALEAPDLGLESRFRGDRRLSHRAPPGFAQPACGSAARHRHQRFAGASSRPGTISRALTLILAMDRENLRSSRGDAADRIRARELALFLEYAPALDIARGAGSLLWRYRRLRESPRSDYRRLTQACSPRLQDSA